MNKIKVATGQFVDSWEIDKNKKVIIKMMKTAKKQDAKILLTHECCLTGYLNPAWKDLNNELDLIQLADALKEISEEAKKLKIYVVVGSILLDKDNKSYTNSVIVINDKGKKECTYHKIALTSGDQKFFKQGKDTPTFKIGKVIFGLQICFDARFPDNYRKLFKKGVHIVLHAYHQTGMKGISEQRRSLLTAFQRVRSSENAIYTVTSNAMEKTKDDLQWVPTMIVSPRGDILKQQPPLKPGVISLEIDADDIIENVENEVRKHSADFTGVIKLPKRTISNKYKKDKAKKS